jgi:NAD(P)-dependent dehydrogenase (short-subunit alcohol dehydrogenase family)
LTRRGPASDAGFLIILNREQNAMRDLTGKMAFVTGDASGIGFALTRGFLEAGMKVVADIGGPALDKACALDAAACAKIAAAR